MGVESSSFRVAAKRALAEPVRILIADDEAVTRKLLELTLKSWGYQVQVVSNGSDAWEVLSNEDGPDMAILDWIMPGLDGPAVCERLRKLTGKYVYVLLLTSRDSKLDMVRGLDAGADDYIAKPFDMEELNARLRAGRRIVHLEHELRESAARDVLTGLWSRRAIFDLLNREFQRARRSQASLAVALADLDHFKRVNDTYGHLAGDVVLRQCAQRVQNVLRAYDSVGRYGGEEMLVLLPQCDTERAAAICERIRQAVAREPIRTDAGMVEVTVSLGLISEAIASDVTTEQLLERADRALYRAKANGRNRVELHVLNSELKI